MLHKKGEDMNILVVVNFNKISQVVRTTGNDEVVKGIVASKIKFNTLK